MSNSNNTEQTVQIKLGENNLSIPLSVASSPVTVIELISVVQSLQKFVVSSSIMSITATTKPDELDNSKQELYNSLFEVTHRLLEMIGARHG